MTEQDLYAPLLAGISQMRRLRGDSLIASELPLHGRRIDVAILTRSGSLSAIELKLRDMRGAIGQAALNTHSFERSYIAVPAVPGAAIIDRARDVGVGIFVVNGSTRLVLEAQRRDIDAVVRDRVISGLKQRGLKWEHVRSSL